jgi:cell division septation protein DedD
MALAACLVMGLTGCVESGVKDGAATNSGKSSSSGASKTAARTQSDIERALAEAEAAEAEYAKKDAGKVSQKTTAKTAKVSNTKLPREERREERQKRAIASLKGEMSYVVQVGTFRVEENAKKLEEKLKAAGLPVMQKKIERENGVLFAVRLEPTPNRQEAEKFAENVKSVSGQEALILSLGR